MGNIVTTIRRFLSNKNTITILGVMLGIVVLYVGYNYRVKTAVETVVIPYATQEITATSKITADSVATMEVLRSMVVSSKSIISNYAEVVNTVQANCASERMTIPSGSFFYKDQIKPCNAVTNNALKEMPDGYRAVSLAVDLQKTYGNSMQPGDYIDLYVKAQSEDHKLIYGEFITKLPILDVRDNTGQSIFYGTSTSNTPALLLFAVPNYDEVDPDLNLYLLLAKASMLSSIELIPVPGNKAYTSEVGETRVTSQYLKQLIINQTLTIPNESVQDVY
ncbi:MAG: hypothetical protein NC483_04195 [Ruminococcus sp.]|nr:hypothetical protein [Ruminococcus sp.]